MSRRTDRVAHLIQRAASEVIQRELNDPRIGFVTVTGVKVSPDLRNAILFVSVVGEEKDVEDSLRGLRHSLPYISRRIAPKLDLRYMPSLAIEFDDTELKADRIEHILDELGPYEENEE